LERKCIVSSLGSRLVFCTAQKQDIFNPYEQSYTLAQHAVQTAIRSVVQRWPWIRSAGVDYRSLYFSFGAGIKILWKRGPGYEVTFCFRQ